MNDSLNEKSIQNALCNRRPILHFKGKMSEFSHSKIVHNLIKNCQNFALGIPRYQISNNLELWFEWGETIWPLYLELEKEIFNCIPL